MILVYCTKMLQARRCYFLLAGTINGRYCCPQLYINHRCFSGPYLNKGRIAELPQSVGPGKCVLVLKEVRLGYVLGGFQRDFRGKQGSRVARPSVVKECILNCPGAL